MEEDLLQQVLGLLGRAGHPEHQVIQASRVCPVELVERPRLAFATASCQLQIRRSHLTCRLRRYAGVEGLPAWQRGPADRGGRRGRHEGEDGVLPRMVRLGAEKTASARLWRP